MSTNEHLFRNQQGLFARLTQENGSYQGYLADLQEAWKIADTQTRQQLRDGQPPTSFADCIRYALIHTTIVGNLGHHPPLPSVYNNPPEPPLTTEALFKRMGELEGATLPRSPLETIAQIGDPGRRAEAFLQIAEDAPIDEREPIIRLAVASMLATQEGYWEFPSYLWERLAVLLNGDQVSEYMQSVFAADNEIASAWFISIFAKMMPHNMWREILHRTFLIQDHVARAFTLRTFLHGSRGKQRSKILQSMVQATRKLQDPNLRSRLLVELVGKLSGRQRAQVIQQALATIPLVRGPARGWDAAELLPYLSSAERTRFIERVLSAKGIFSQLEAYLTLWSHLPQQTRQQATKIALGIREPTDRANYLARIASKLRTKRAYREMIRHIANAILAIRNEDQRRTTILSVQGEVQDKSIEQVANLPINRLTPDIETLAGYRFAFAERDPQHVAYALGNLSAFMSDTRRAQTLPLMVDLALEIDLHDYVAEAIEGIAPYLDEYHLNKAFEGALQIGNSWSRVWALSGLAAFLKGSQRKKCLDAAVEASGLLDRTYQADNWFEVDMAARLLPHLKGRPRERVLMRGLAAAKINDFNPMMRGSDS